LSSQSLRTQLTPEMQITPSILALDVGERRIGVAIASLEARLARPLTTLLHDDGLLAGLEKIIAEENVQLLVVGYPRNMSGDTTAQTRVIEEFTEELKRKLDLPVEYQDEALTSQKAETELEARGGTYQKGDIDALAATYILEDYLIEHGRSING
jgi:putative Holliday junction resolvase